MRKSPNAKLMMRNEWTRLTVLNFHRHEITNRLPIKATEPRTQIQIRRIVFDIRSSHEENSFGGGWHVST